LRIAGIDCGTNSIRLLINDFSQDNNQMHEIVREMRIVRLGEGVDKNKRFSEAALKRTFEAIDEYAQLISENKVDKIRFVATSATRDAENKEEFFSGVRARLNIEAEVITGEVEAALSFMGATKSLAANYPPPYLIIDLGGGSTELVLGDKSPIAAYSMDVGCVRMTERHSPGGNPTVEQIKSIREDVANQLIKAKQVVAVDTANTVIGVAGTVTTVAAHVLNISSYDPDLLHGAEITSDSITKTAEDFARLSFAERGKLPYMHPGRVEVITAGSIVLDEVVKGINAKRIIASERDILDGVTWSLVL
jgi:exopolyphosphatase / guanosine-5'-triphosphate,3'-diphosphate pyrophosphatase